jgi:hypothetical protein
MPDPSVSATRTPSPNFPAFRVGASCLAVETRAVERSSLGQPQDHQELRPLLGLLEERSAATLVAHCDTLSSSTL